MPSIFKHNNGHTGPDPVSLALKTISASTDKQKNTKAGQTWHDKCPAIPMQSFPPQVLQAAAEELSWLEEVSVFLNAGVYKVVGLEIILSFIYSTNGRRQIIVSLFGCTLQS